MNEIMGNPDNQFSIPIFLIRLYQKTVSPLLPGRCRFYPSCSEYAIQSYKHYSLLRATAKTAYRILRCNPFSKGYYDPAVKMDTSDMQSNQKLDTINECK